MIIAGMVKTSLIDFPGKIATVLFTPGCDYNCFYCHNRELIENVEDTLDINEIEAFLKKRQGLIDGVVITGGEPTLHKDLIPFLLKIKQYGYMTKLDSNGSNPEVITACINAKAVDYYAIDYKAPAHRYLEIARGNADVEQVKRTIQILIDTRQFFEVRTTVIPQLSIEDLIQMADELPTVPKYVLNPYTKPSLFLEEDQELIEMPPYSESQIKEFAEILKLYQPNMELIF
ncbi:MAG: anaerobic ribonucleoside-triphosphate reductase activating protein [Firmicutes bacterium]|nr:anaerobic ribonucleoside-triphosphate reductase activating protein [Bacillota bacterium]